MHYGAMWGTKRHSAGTHAQIGEEQSFPVRDWKDGVFICADSCSSSAIAAAYIHTPVYRPVPMDGPSLRELGVLDALTGQTPVGVAVSPTSQQNIKSRRAVDSISLPVS